MPKPNGEYRVPPTRGVRGAVDLLEGLRGCFGGTFEVDLEYVNSIAKLRIG